MNVTDYIAAINAPGVNVLHMQWTTTVKPAAAHKARILQKITTANVMTGVEYANLSVNNDTETGDLPWGEWGMYPYIITHKGMDYFRLYTIDGSVRSTYLVDGEVVDRDTFNGYLTPSQANASRPNGGTITVKAENVRLVGQPSFA